MPEFRNPEALAEFRSEAAAGYRATRGELERRAIMDICYVSGQQWCRAVPTGMDFNRTGGISRLQTDYSAESSKIRVTANKTTALTHKSAVATFPHAMEAEVFPPDRDAGSESVVLAQTCEDALAVMMDAAGYHAVRRDANFLRAVWGTYCVGLSLRTTRETARIYGSEVSLPSTEVRAFSFDPTRLTLDPDERSRMLSGHEFVIYSAPMSARRIAEVYGVRLREDELRTIGQLAPFEMSLNEISQNQVYAQYRAHSKTKGAIVHESYFRGPDGRFGTMFIEIESPERTECINFDEPVSMFGFHGLPFEFIHGHRRTDGPFGLSEPTMMRGEQDGLNLTRTQVHRMMARNAGFQVAVDRNSLGRSAKEDEEFRNAVTNMVGGTLFYSSGTRDKPGHAPQLIQYPQPAPVMLDIAREYEQAMMEQIHRPQVTQGLLKSHVPDAVYQTALEQAGQVLGARVAEDVLVDNSMLTVLLGTTARLVREMSPGTLALLRRKRFTPDALAMLADLDPASPGVEVRVREGSIRFRSPDAKREDLRAAVQVQAITPSQFRMSLVRDTDTPLTQDDKFFSRRAELAALSILRGASWRPVPLGEYAEWFLAAFRRAILDPMADEAAVERLEEAIVLQQQVMAAEAMAGNPVDSAPPAPNNAPTQATDIAGMLDSLGAVA